MSSLSVAVIDSNEDWQKLALQWNALLNASGSGVIFLTWEWLSSWVENCLGRNRSLFIIVFHENEQLAGIAPFYIDNKKFGLFSLREIHFLGSPETGSDYLDVIARKGREKDVANSLFDFLMGDGATFWDQLVLSDIPSSSFFLLHFLNRIQYEGKHAELTYGCFCPTANLMGAEEQFPVELSLKRKKKFKQELGILHRNSEVEYVVRKGEHIDSFDEFFRLYEEKGGWSGKVLRPVLCGFIERHNGNSPVQIDLLSVKGQTIAGLLHLHYRNTQALYLMAVDKGFNPKISVGNLLVGLSIQNAVVNGQTTYDFLKGDEGYKFHWSSQGQSTMQLVFWQKRPSAMVSGLLQLARNAGKLLLR